jgi:hypothetical protein
MQHHNFRETFWIHTLHRKLNPHCGCKLYIYSNAVQMTALLVSHLLYRSKLKPAGLRSTAVFGNWRTSFWREYGCELTLNCMSLGPNTSRSNPWTSITSECNNQCNSLFILKATQLGHFVVLPNICYEERVIVPRCNAIGTEDHLLVVKRQKPKVAHSSQSGRSS